MSDPSVPELTPEAEAAGHDPAKVSEPTIKQLREGVVGDVPDAD